jgi:hypothetical protein
VTYSPDDLLAVRAYLQRQTGLSPAELGIAGDPAHAATGGYHEGRDDLARVGLANNDYSVRESPRDRAGLTNAASALDIGANFGRFREITLALVDAARRGDPRMRDVREIIYTPEGSTVRRWDRLGVRSSGDSSHLWHTHLSFFRDSEGRRADNDNFLGLLRELFEGAPPPDVEDDMANFATSSYEIKPGFADYTDGSGRTRPELITVVTIPSTAYAFRGYAAYLRFFADNPGNTVAQARLRVAIRKDAVAGGGWDVRGITIDATRSPDEGNSTLLPEGATGLDIYRLPLDANDPGTMPVSFLVEYTK